MAEKRTGMDALIDASVAFRQTERLLQLKIEKHCTELATWAGCAIEAPPSDVFDELDRVISTINRDVRPVLDDLRRLREGREEAR